MEKDATILELLAEQTADVARRARRAVIIQPGAIGDCILTLPLAAFLKKTLQLGSADMFGRSEYIGIFPGRTCIDGIRSLDSLELHRLFGPADTFEPNQLDVLVEAFAEYSWIVTFLGEPNSNFEKNLIFTANCSHSAEVVTVPLKPGRDDTCHISDFYIRYFCGQFDLPPDREKTYYGKRLIKPTAADARAGRQLLRDFGIAGKNEVVIIHPGSGGSEKCWALENFLAVACSLQQQGFDVIFVIGPAELERFSDTDLVAVKSIAPCLRDSSLTQVLGALSCADSFIGNDSGITHLAAAMGIKTCAMFGPTDPEVYKPIGPNVSVIEDTSGDFAEKPSRNMQQHLIDQIMS